MAHCEFENNAFCSKLTEEDRATLCKNCQIFKFLKRMDPRVVCPRVGSQLLYPNDKCCVLILRGMICTSDNRKMDSPRAYIISQPGDIMNPETVFGERDPLNDHRDFHYVVDGAYAVFSSRILRNMFLSSPAFASVLFQTVADTRMRQIAFLLQTQLNDAYSSLLYILLLCKESGIKPLTHQDMALITNLNRTTVTKTLKRILAEENLNISLKDYIQATDDARPGA